MSSSRASAADTEAHPVFYPTEVEDVPGALEELPEFATVEVESNLADRLEEWIEWRRERASAIDNLRVRPPPLTPQAPRRVAGLTRVVRPCLDTGHPVAMSRGPTRRVRQLLASGAVSGELLAAADHEADLLSHPYVGVEHVELARLRAEARAAEYERLRREVAMPLPRRWWRPLGPRSAFRPSGLEETEERRVAAESRRPGGPPGAV